MWSFITEGQLLFHALSTRRPFTETISFAEPENPFLLSSDVISIKPKSLTVPPTSVKNDFRIEQSSVNKTTAEIKSSEAVSK